MLRIITAYPKGYLRIIGIFCSLQVIFLCLPYCSALLVGWVWCSGGVPIDGREWVIRLLAGHGTGYFYPLGFMALLLAELLPLWPGGPISYTGNERKLGFSDDTIKAAEQYVAIITLCIGRNG